MAKKEPEFKKINPPVEAKTVSTLKAGDRVLITGTIYTARDAAHQLFENRPPFTLKGNILYYASPTPAPKGRVIGSIGPTTATRMDPFTLPLLKAGLKIMIGKGRRGPEIVAAIKKYKAAYLVVPGGVAALLSKHVKKAKVLAYPDLGPEAVMELEVADFPAIVAIDSKGVDLFERGRKQFEI